MMYEIREWTKAETGVYVSDQKTFDYKIGKYIGVYRIEKKHGEWELQHSIQNGNDEMDGRRYESKGYFKTLREAKDFAEVEFGHTYRVDDIDRA